jgi:hypothetical protein
MNHYETKFKGWMQTLITLSRSPLKLVAEIGIRRSASIALLFIAVLFGPLFWVPANLVMIGDILRHGIPVPADFYGVCLATLWASVGLFGSASLFWFALLGMKRRGLFHLWPVLLLLPVYYCLHTIAAWMAFIDLLRHPFHWQKTEHGLPRKAARALYIPVLGRSLPVLNRMPR